MRRATSLAAWVLCAIACTAAAVSAETLDDRAYAVARQLMCPVCVGQTVAESDSTLAREMKTIIREKLAAGETPDQILQFFVGQFGESVLAEPHPGGAALLLYAGPPAALILGLAIAVLYIRRGRSRGAATNPSAPGA
ncbi:MAG TPA: cytochrome c-type biogenesis protein [bacterium]|nr:cytochrome c-type biogenesis protein [bacterium]